MQYCGSLGLVLGSLTLLQDLRLTQGGSGQSGGLDPQGETSKSRTHFSLQNWVQILKIPTFFNNISLVLVRGVLKCSQMLQGSQDQPSKSTRSARKMCVTSKWINIGHFDMLDLRKCQYFQGL